MGKGDASFNSEIKRGPVSTQINCRGSSLQSVGGAQASLFGLSTDKRKSVADLVAGASWTEKAFVKAELVCNKATES